MMANLVYNSQIIPLNIGVPKLSPPSWPYTSGSYTDTGTYIQSAFTNTSQNPSVITINNGAFNTGTIKSINCYEIHDSPAASLSSVASNVYEVKNIQWGGGGTNTTSVLNRLYPTNNTIESYLEVSASTKGNRICLEGQGALTNIMDGTVLDTAHDYFVLIHADNHLKHHIAKITEIHKYEVDGDGFDFAPKYDEDITSGTKVSIYKGPAAADTHIVAVGYGLMGDGADADYRHDTYVEVSRPTFYFYEDRCDINKLKPNTKYKIIKNIAYVTGGNLTFDFGKKMSAAYSTYNTSAPDIQKYGTAICFKTNSIYGGYVKDKTAYTQFGSLVDNLKIHDERIFQSSGVMKGKKISVGAVASWASASYSTDVNISLGEWDKCFWNINRDSHHANSQSLELYNSDITRYVNYTDSDTKNNHLPQVSSVNTYDSVVDIGNYVEIKLPDPNKILGFKLNTYDKILIRDNLNDEEYSGSMNIPLYGKIASSTTGWTLTFTELTAKQDLRTIWGSSPTAGLNPDGLGHSNTINKLRVGNFIFAGDFNSASTQGLKGYEQVFTITHRRNIITDNTWIACTSNWSLESIIDGTAFVYTYNSKSNLFMGSFDIDTEYDGTNLTRNGQTITFADSYLKNTELFIRDKELTGLKIPLKYGDKNLNYIKPDDITYDSYQIKTRIGAVTTGNVNTYTVANIPTIYDYINGDVVLDNIIFDGNIEMIEESIDVSGMLTYNITGRDEITKLLDSIINKNYTHTNEYVYSTNNPVNDLITPSDTWEIEDFDIGDTNINIFRASSTTSGTVIGDMVFCYINSKCRLLGIVNNIIAQNNPTGTYWNGSTHAAIPASQYGWQLQLTEGVQYSSLNKAYGAVNFRIGKNSISAGKALSSTLTDIIRPTTLEGCSNKGVEFTGGEYINNATGVKLGDLTDLSANDSPYSQGFPISNIKGNDIGTNLSDYKFNIMSNIAETAIASHDTISSLSEYGILKIEALENQLSLITLAPIFPIVLAKTAANTSDTRFSNSQGIYFANTQGLPNGGFLHYIGSETNAVGAPVTFSNPGYIDDPTAADGIDYRYEDNYGNFIWRYTGLQESESSLIWNNAFLDRVWDKRYRDLDEPMNKMYGTNTGVSGYASAVRVEYDGVIRDWDYQGIITDHWLQQFSPEGREGFYNIEGTRFWDIAKMPTDIKNQVTAFASQTETFSFKINNLKSYYPKLSMRNGTRNRTDEWTGTVLNLHKYRRKYESFDTNIENFYLFSIGDIYPESYKRTNSIGYINRDLSKYGIIFKTKGAKSSSTVLHNNYSGTISDTLESDASYEIMPINSSDKNTSELKRFGLARLIEVTYDWHFNEVDYEHLQEMTKNEENGGYAIIPTLGDLIEHDYTASYSAGLADKGNPRVNGFGVDGQGDLYTDSGSRVSNSAAPYFTTNTAPYNYPREIMDGKWFYTDSWNFSTTSTNIFGKYDPQVIGQATVENIYPDSNSGGAASQDGSWHTLTGILNGNLSARVTQQPNGGVVATHNNIVTTTDSTRGRGYICNITLDSGTNVSSIVFHSNASAVFSGISVKHRGGHYAAGDTITISSTEIGGSQNVIITLQAGDLTTENRVYINQNAHSLEQNIEGASSTTKCREYTGLLKMHAQSMDRLRVTHTLRQSTNKGDFIHASGASFYGTTDYYFFNYTTILGRIQDSINPFYKGYLENDTGTSQTAAEKQTSYHLFLPFYITPSSGVPDRNHLHEAPTSTGLSFSTISGTGTFEYSRIFDKMSCWDEGTENATTCPIGYGPSHLYTDMIGILKNMKPNDHTKIGKGSWETTTTSNNGVTVPLIGVDAPGYNVAVSDTQFHSRESTGNVKEEKYEGATMPNLHIAYVHTDNNSKYLSLQYAYNFENSSQWKIKTTYSYSSSAAYGSLSTQDFRFLSSGYTSLKTEDGNDFLLNKSSQISGAEIFFKPVFSTMAKNVTKIELDTLTQSTGIVGSVSVKANKDTTNGRLIFKVEELDITTYANNGKNAAENDVAAFPRINHWLQFANDLTGHYLVSEKSRHGNAVTTQIDADRDFIQESNPDNIHQVISHNINQTGKSITHYIEIDNVTYTTGAAVVSKFYRVMRIAKDCMFNFTPNEIELNKLTNRFTKIPASNYCYTEIANMNFFPQGGSASTNKSACNEAVLSMYVGLDVDGKPNSDYIVRRSLDSIATDTGTNNSFVNDRAYHCLLTDGNNDYHKDILFTKSGTTNNYIRFSGQMVNMKGIVSFGESFSMTTYQSPQNLLSKRCNLGSTFDVVEEVDEIVNSIVENLNINYTVDYENNIDMYYSGYNYNGANSFYTITDLLRYKNKRLVIDGREFSTKEMIPTTFYTNIRLSERDTDTQISNIKRVESSYDFFNSVTVYGDGVKATARNRKSIKQINRTKEKEITDLTIKSEKSAYAKALSMLSLVDSLENQIKFNISKTKIRYLKAGQVITIDYPSQNIPSAYYQVLEIQNTFGQLPRLTVGKFSKTMASQYADLTLKNIKAEANIRGGGYVSTDVAVQEALEPKIKIMKLTISKLSGPNTLIGFNNLVGFSSTIGFVAGSGQAFEILLNKDLTE